MARKTKPVVAVVELASEVIEYTVVDVVGDTGSSQVLADEIDESNEIQSVESEPMSMTSQLIAQLSAQSTEHVAEKKDKNEGVGMFIKKLIAEGLSNKDILPIVHEQYGNKNTTYACVAWYRNKMNKAGAQVKKASNVEWLQNFSKANGLSEEAVQELERKVG